MPGERTQIGFLAAVLDLRGVADDMAVATLPGRRSRRHTGADVHDRVVGKVRLDRRDVIAAWPMASLAADARVRGFRARTNLRPDRGIHAGLSHGIAGSAQLRRERGRSGRAGFAMSAAVPNVPSGRGPIPISSAHGNDESRKAREPPSPSRPTMVR